MAMNVETEIRDLKRRVSEIEGSFGFLTRQIKAVHKDLLAFQERTEQKFDQVHGRLDRMDGRPGGTDRSIRSLRDDMPGIVGSAVRESLRERPRTARKKP